MITGTIKGTFSTVTGLGVTITATYNTTSFDLDVHAVPPTFTADTPPAAGVGSCLFVSVPGQRHHTHHLFGHGSAGLGSAPPPPGFCPARRPLWWHPQCHRHRQQREPTECNRYFHPDRTG